MKNTKKIYASLIGLNLLGALVSLYLSYIHFKPETSTICNFGEKWNCDIVNKSIYAEILGIPVALLGLIAYIGFFIFSVRGLKKDQKKIMPYYLVVLSLGLAFALYLTAIETFVLKTYCMFCVIQQVIILITFGLSIWLSKLTKK
jgi:uncharacterized membrane protein